MKTKKQILDQIKAIKADSRWPKKRSTAARHCRNESFYRDLLDQVAAHLGEVALIQINAPLALIQVSMEAKVEALRWVMKTEGKTDG